MTTSDLPFTWSELSDFVDSVQAKIEPVTEVAFLIPADRAEALRYLDEMNGKGALDGYFARTGETIDDLKQAVNNHHAGTDQ